MVKIVFLVALATASLSAVWACAPHQAYMRQYQTLHSGNPCVQCQAVEVQSSCSNNWQNGQFGCSTPTVNYGLQAAGQCAQATITCLPSQGGAQSVMVVALLDNSDGRFGQNSQVYAPISGLSSGHANVVQPCSMESQWMSQSTDDFRLAQPLTVQCAHNVPGYVLPPVSERYQSGPSAAVQEVQPCQQLQPCQEVHPPQSIQTVETNEGHVVDEDVQVIILGTTLVPVVKERVVQNVIKEVHNYPIQKKKIIKTKRISKPTAFAQEYIERIPGTKIVPTYEERRATQIIRGTTMIPMVEEMEVTEMLPELPVMVEQEQPKLVEQTGYETAPKVLVQEHVVSGYETQPKAVVQQTGYETATPAAAVQQVPNTPY